MIIPRLHAWPRLPRAAIALQSELAGRVVIAPLRLPVLTVAGVDVAFSPDGRQVVAGVVNWSVDRGVMIESQIALRANRFPYVPGLLSFRELPAVLAALRKLRSRPDVVLCDGQGIAHPRRCGLATHLGLWLDRPTIGCAKSRLIGTHAEPGRARGARVALMDGREKVGCVLRTRAGVRPVWVSVGHRCDLESAVGVILAVAGRFRLPEPARLAHQLVSRARLGSG